MIGTNGFGWRHAAVSALGAMTLSALSVFAAAAPARAEAPATLPAWQAAVARQIDGKTFEAGSLAPGATRVAAVRAAFTADGDFAGATLAQSSGDRAIDARALGVARHLAYPRLPAAFQGTPRDVTVMLRFSDRADMTAPEVARTAARQDRIAAR